MRLALFLVCLTSAIIALPTYAESTLLTEKHFSVVKQMITNDKQPKHTLLVLDDDDTLTMLPCSSKSDCQYIGGPAWYQWQANLKPTNPDRVSTTTNGLLSVNTLVLDMSRSVLVEKDILDTLKLAKKRGVRILVATARGYNMLAATEKQLSENHLLSIISSDTITALNGKTSLPGPYLPKDAKYPIQYQNGILYLSGQNKGAMLKAFLNKTDKINDIKHVIFVDDTLKNDQQMAAEFKNDPNIQVDSIHYTYLKDHKLAFLKGNRAAQLQSTANKRWHTIKSSLNEALPGADLTS